MSERHSASADDTPGELAPRQIAALGLLLAGRGVEEAAKQAGVTERTVWRWLSDSEPFKRELRARQRQAMEDATAKLQAAASEAVEALQRVMRDKSAPPSAVVSAAKAVLEGGYRGVEMADLVQRVEQLEAELSQAATEQPRKLLQ